MIYVLLVGFLYKWSVILPFYNLVKSNAIIRIKAYPNLEYSAQLWKSMLHTKKLKNVIYFFYFLFSTVTTNISNIVFSIITETKNKKKKKFCCCCYSSCIWGCSSDTRIGEGCEHNFEFCSVVKLIIIPILFRLFQYIIFFVYKIILKNIS